MSVAVANIEAETRQLSRRASAHSSVPVGRTSGDASTNRRLPGGCQFIRSGPFNAMRPSPPKQVVEHALEQSSSAANGRSTGLFPVLGFTRALKAMRTSRRAEAAVALYLFMRCKASRVRFRKLMKFNDLPKIGIGAPQSWAMPFPPRRAGRGGLNVSFRNQRKSRRPGQLDAAAPRDPCQSWTGAAFAIRRPETISNRPDDGRGRSAGFRPGSVSSFPP